MAAISASIRSALGSMRSPAWVRAKPSRLRSNSCADSLASRDSTRRATVEWLTPR